MSRAIITASIVYIAVISIGRVKVFSLINNHSQNYVKNNGFSFCFNSKVKHNDLNKDLIKGC